LVLLNFHAFGYYHGTRIGFWGEFESPQTLEKFTHKINDLYRTTATVFPFGPELIKRVGVISGGAQSHSADAAALKLDAFVTGEVSEYNMQFAREEGFHFVAAGHYATERLGIQALGKQVARQFGLEVEYIDVPVPV